MSLLLQNQAPTLGSRYVPSFFWPLLQLGGKASLSCPGWPYNLPGSASQVFEVIGPSHLAWLGQSFSKFIQQKLFLHHLSV